MKIRGSTILLTGAGGGIGSAIARQLARQGASVVLANRDVESLQALVAELQVHGGRVLALPVDLADPQGPARLVSEAIDRTGGIDILINCAGLQNFGFLADESPEATAALLQVNTVAPMLLTRALLPHLLAAGQGQIVNVGSIFGSIGFPCFASYSASKFAIRGFSEALRRELADTGIRVTYVAPRFTRTPFNSGVVTRMAEALKMNQDDPEAVATSVVAAIERDGTDQYLGWPEKLFVRINAVLPRLVDPSLIKQVALMRPFATERNR
ncbi:SDR family oxidoreductase [Nitrogeniibacter mangrovi]|uniref:SDR family oxidoreductase n=1 Tax=Nitrogeniibacter mangrovi TaxID=2016596 RepID=A0A6C1AZT5_9RHOO|nr:SDR family oxidoreductase [Nitrogeniibacter mangrovi]QID16249.1 SDR family oxidoreductase [Nitrogeniibacter mangrovi]